MIQQLRPLDGFAFARNLQDAIKPALLFQSSNEALACQFLISEASKHRPDCAVLICPFLPAGRGFLVDTAGLAAVIEAREQVRFGTITGVGTAPEPARQPPQEKPIPD